MTDTASATWVDGPRGAGAPERSIRLLQALFFFSGFPALIYQLVWQRALFRIFGVNVESVTVVVTAFMLGLGLGSLAGGWLSRRHDVPLLPLLAAIELATGAFGLVSLRVFDAVAALVLGASLPVVAAVSLALVLVPTLLMGATLPVLVGHLVRRNANVGSSVGVLYEVNTLGAGAACLVAAGALFPFLGMRGALHVAVAANAAVAAGAILAQLRGRSPSVAPGPASAPSGQPETLVPRFAAVLGLGALGGFVSLSYEMFFFRTISYATGSSAPAFAITLCAFLVGLASGARRAARGCRRGPRHALAAALRALLAGNALGWAFLPLAGAVAPLGWAALAVALALVFLVARSWGVLLPTLAHLGVPADRDAGMRTAQLYLANIVGSAAGSVVTGFVLMDRLSLAGIAAALVLAGVLTALLLGAAVSGLRPAPTAWALGAGALAAASLPSLSSGVLERLTWKSSTAGKPAFSRIIQNRSGILAVDATGTVFGHGLYDGRFNTDLVHDTNGIVRAYALGLFHPSPRHVLSIGLSSGSWAQVIANHPELESLTVVEINPGCLELVRGDPAVASVLSNPKVAIHVDDARRWLSANPHRRFDAIVSNTTYHFRAHASSLLSAEFLALVRGHLRPGGIFFYNTTGSERAQRTGCLAFPHGVRFSNQLVVSDAPLDLDFARWRRTLEAYRIDGRPVLDPSRPDDRRALAALLSMETALEPGGGSSPARPVERCQDIAARTAGKAPITDDNMGSEWRVVFGLE
ncbi:fused MFS/spermidine synthase [Anaeromyxobacter sp. Fw109-5]|uniref:fused MFS/spermidine synthase n=1 Tax=Anaeromyxobacter sp. (strain Fw109-5) TaxID=404589 RepID=UPI0000ED7D43|nr:fused MFS/spermidine synthase [Anaeromyxobacter sp. Fw109-5]ABS25817.1 Spermine synthase [Anaeromyxobacter sp. Fw109-5]